MTQVNTISAVIGENLQTYIDPEGEPHITENDGPLFISLPSDPAEALKAARVLVTVAREVYEAASQKGGGRMTITRGFDFNTYRRIDAINWSLLKELAKSPAHFRYRQGHERPDTPRLAMGRAVHTAVLEPDRFPLEYTLWDGGRRAGKEWDAFGAANSGTTILKLEDYETCLAVRDAVRGNAICADMLRGSSEVTAEWVDEDTGLACKGRIDHINEDCIVDLKTTSSVDEWTFSALSARMMYHSQLAFYNAGVRMEHNPRIIAVEIEPPYDVAIFKVTDDLLAVGQQQVSDLLYRLKACVEADEWPGRYTGEVELTTPSWLNFDDGDLSGLGITIGEASISEGGSL